jgi:8-hydroxy-5-deazaflavin:NADPH oxidoreductase
LLRRHVKTIVDIANPLDFSHGVPPALAPVGTDSLGEQIQRELPQTRVVKALNTVNCEVMVDPARVPGEHDVFVCGDYEDANAQVREVLESFGWPPSAILDLGGIAAARGMEGYLLLWLRLWGAIGSGDFNIKVVK